MSTMRAVLLVACALLAVALAKGAQQDREKPASEEIQIPAGKENLPAEQVFKSIEVLKGEPASRLPGMMKAFNRMLGVECTHCHVAGAWGKEEPEAKRTARLMFKMIGNVSQKYIDTKNEVTCWTCHHGGPKPSNGGAEIGAAMAKLPAERQQVIANLNNLGEDKPAEQVFGSIQVLKGLSVERMLRVMGVFTVVLGVDCSHCHVADQWDDDHPAKDITREMLRMVRDINQQLFDGQAKVACWTCHRGAVKPEAAPRLLAAPDFEDGK